MWIVAGNDGRPLLVNLAHYRYVTVREAGAGVADPGWGVVAGACGQDDGDLVLSRCASPQEASAVLRRISKAMHEGLYLLTLT